MTKYKAQIRKETLLEVLGLINLESEKSLYKIYNNKFSGLLLAKYFAAYTALKYIEHKIQKMVNEIKQDTKKQKYNGSFSPHGDSEYLV